MRYYDKKLVVKKFREKLSSKGQSLKWWHATYIPEMYKYNYFIRQISTPDSLRPDLINALREFVLE